MSTADDRDRVRIGNAERTAADDSLREHLAAGRLSVDEYSERVAKVYDARTRADLDELFSDLPSGPFGMPSPTARLQPPADADLERRGYGQPPVQDNTRRVLVALMGAAPIVALLLFLGLRAWWIWLLIPLVGVLIGPFLRNDDDGRKR